MKNPIKVVLGRGAFAGAIKLTNAGLGFLMFVAVSLITDERQFGLFGTAFAAASLASYFGTIGQQAAILRFWPQYAASQPLVANSYLARAIGVALSGAAGAGLAFLALALAPWPPTDVPEWRTLCLSAGFLSAWLSWSEFVSGAFRAKNQLLQALLPKDIVWRSLVLLACAGFYWSDGETSAVSILFACAALLALATGQQTTRLLIQAARAPKAALSGPQKREFANVSLGLWGVNALPPALGEVSTILVASLLGVEAAGAVFAAERATRIIILALNGLNQVVAPDIASAYYNGDRKHVQWIANVISIASFTAALLMLGTFYAFGLPIMRVFDDAYGTAEIVTTLVILATGQTFAAACGPTNVILQLTGQQNAFLRTLLTVNVAGLGVTAIAAHYFGIVGAALAIAATLASWNVVAVIQARRRLNIDPSIAGLLQSWRPILNREVR